MSLPHLVVKLPPQSGCSSESLAALVQSSGLVQRLRDGCVIAVPTDTIYGLACLAQSTRAIADLYSIKVRDAGKPVAICVAEPSRVFYFCHVTVSMEVLRALLPGPVTLVFERKSLLNPDLNPATSLVGVRVPDHAFISTLCSLLGEPLALTSANPSGSPSTLETSEFETLWPRLGAVVDAGRLSDSRAGSTVVDLSVHSTYRIVRDGSALDNTVRVLRSFGINPAATQ